MLTGLIEEHKQDWKLRPMLELAGEQGQWVDVERLAQLILAHTEQLHQPRGLLAAGTRCH